MFPAAAAESRPLERRQTGFMFSAPSSRQKERLEVVRAEGVCEDITSFFYFFSPLSSSSFV
jgi:hypothetical protein